MSFTLDALDSLIARYFRPLPRTSGARTGKIAGNANVPVPAIGGLPVLLLSIDHPDCDDRTGLVTVHIAVKSGDLAARVPNGAGGSFNSNGRLIAHVKWNTGNMIGECDLDVTGGAIFTCAGTQGITIFGSQVTADEAGAGDDGAPALVPGEDLIVNAACAWGGQAAPPRAAFMTALRQKMNAGTEGNLQLIPDGAQSMAVASDTLANPMVVKLYDIGAGPVGGAPAAGATPRYIQDIRLSDPTQFTIPIVAGARMFTVTPTKTSKNTAIFPMVI